MTEIGGRIMYPYRVSRFAVDGTSVGIARALLEVNESLKEIQATLQKLEETLGTLLSSKRS